MKSQCQARLPDISAPATRKSSSGIQLERQCSLIITQAHIVSPRCQSPIVSHSSEPEPFDGHMDMTEPAPQPAEDPQSQLENGDSTALRTLCAQLHEKVNSFLQEDVKTERLQATQEQTRRSLAVIQEALDKYEFASPQILPTSYHFDN